MTTSNQELLGILARLQTKNVVIMTEAEHVYLIKAVSAKAWQDGVLNILLEKLSRLFILLSRARETMADTDVLAAVAVKDEVESYVNLINNNLKTVC
jgi:hypothetical protein